MRSAQLKLHYHYYVCVRTYFGWWFGDDVVCPDIFKFNPIKWKRNVIWALYQMSNRQTMLSKGDTKPIQNQNQIYTICRIKHVGSVYSDRWWCSTLYAVRGAAGTDCILYVEILRQWQWRRGVERWIKNDCRCGCVHWTITRWRKCVLTCMCRLQSARGLRQHM